MQWTSFLALDFFPCVDLGGHEKSVFHHPLKIVHSILLLTNQCATTCRQEATVWVYQSKQGDSNPTLQEHRDRSGRTTGVGTGASSGKALAVLEAPLV